MRYSRLTLARFDPNFVILSGDNLNIWFAEDDKQIAFSFILGVVSHVEVDVHPRFKYRKANQFAKFCGMGFEVRGAGNQDSEVGIFSFSSGLNQIGMEDNPKFGLML